MEKDCAYVLHYNLTSQNIYFNNARVLRSDVQASNGVVYLIDQVLDVPEGTILHILSRPEYNTSEFLTVLQHAYYTGLLDHTSGYGKPFAE
jgi:hypothetical protein